jgi:hypothetical protein
MGLQVSSGMGAKMPPEGFVRPISQVHRTGATRPGWAEREHDPGRASARRSCALAGVDSTEVFRGSDGVVIRGKSATHIARSYLGRRKNHTGVHLLGQGLFCFDRSTDGVMIRAYIQKQEEDDTRIDQLGLFSED